MESRPDPAVSRLEWRKASYSSSNGGACVEVALAGDTVAVRDSKGLEGPRLAIARSDWNAFTRALKADGACGLIAGARYLVISMVQRAAGSSAMRSSPVTRTAPVASAKAT
jgi:hypothetical protein